MAKKPIAWCDRALVVMPIFYAVCITEKQFHSELKKMKQPPTSFLSSARSNATTTFFEYDGKQVAIVTMPPDEKTDHLVKMAMLVHEATHIWQCYREDIGETAPSHEFEAYSIQRISLELMASYERQCKALKKKGKK